MRSGKMHGNYTLRPLLATMPKADADYYRSLLAEPEPGEAAAPTQ